MLVVEGHDLTDLSDEILGQLAIGNISSEFEENGQFVGLNIELGCQLIEGYFRILSGCSYEEYITTPMLACKKVRSLDCALSVSPPPGLYPS